MQSKQAELRRGVIVFVTLAVLTGVEYGLGSIEAPAAVMWLVALPKAGIVLWFFMHIQRLFTPGEGGH